MLAPCWHPLSRHPSSPCTIRKGHRVLWGVLVVPCSPTLGSQLATRPSGVSQQTGAKRRLRNAAETRTRECQVALPCQHPMCSAPPGHAQPKTRTLPAFAHTQHVALQPRLRHNLAGTRAKVTVLGRASRRARLTPHALLRRCVPDLGRASQPKEGYKTQCVTRVRDHVRCLADPSLLPCSSSSAQQRQARSCSVACRRGARRWQARSHRRLHSSYSSNLARRL